MKSWIRTLQQFINSKRNEEVPEMIQRSGEHHTRSETAEAQVIPHQIEGKITYVYAEGEIEEKPLIRSTTRTTFEERRGEQKRETRQHEQLEGERLRERLRRQKSSTERTRGNRELSRDPEQRQRYQGRLKQASLSPSPITGYQKQRKQRAVEQLPSAEPPLNFARTEMEETMTATLPGDQESGNRPSDITETEVHFDTDCISTEMIQTKPGVEQDDQLEQKFELKTVEEEHADDEANLVPFPPGQSMERETHQPSNQVIRQQEQAAASLSNTAWRDEALYDYPDVTLLSTSATLEQIDHVWLDEQAQLLLDTFSHFNLKADLLDIVQGPTLTRFEVQPAPGIKINKFTNLQDDLKLALAAKEIRMEAPIPGKHAIGIEIPHPHPRPVFLGDLIQTSEFQQAASPLTVCLGAGIDGTPVFTDIQKMPHGLIAGATGSGKSVCINSLIVSLLYKASPQQLRLLLIDPKMVEMMPYQSIPHLVTPVITDPKRATVALKWAVDEMERRYQLFAQEGVRDLEKYNAVTAVRTGEEHALPYIVIIIDELADLMMVAPGEVEDAICRITQKARACGIHLIVATQRPSVDVITGLIKSNIPTRIAFAVSSQVDSRTILDTVGAERLLGKGDMLYLGNGSSKPIRVQGNFVSDDEIQAVVEHVSNGQHFLFTQEELVQHAEDIEEEDELIEEALFHVLEQGTASTSSLQRKFRIGYNRAARMIDWMEKQGMISEAQGSKPRNVLWSQEQFLEWLDQRS